MCHCPGPAKRRTGAGIWLSRPPPRLATSFPHPLANPTLVEATWAVTLRSSGSRSRQQPTCLGRSATCEPLVSTAKALPWKSATSMPKRNLSMTKAASEFRLWHRQPVARCSLIVFRQPGRPHLSPLRFRTYVNLGNAEPERKLRAPPWLLQREPDEPVVQLRLLAFLRVLMRAQNSPLPSVDG